MRTVSVIVPVYNTTEFIDECLQSLIKQIYSQLEIIIINDGSDAACTEKLNKWAKKDERIKLIHNEDQQGVGFSRNLGIAKATGHFIYFLDSDDYLASDTIKLLVENSGGFDIVSGKQQRVHVSQSSVTNQDSEVELFKENKFDLITNRSALNRLFKRSFVIDHKLTFIEDVARYSDLTFMVPAIHETETVAYIDQAIYFKRRRNDPITNPALMQTGMFDRISDYYIVNNQIKETYRHNDRINQFIDDSFIRIYRRSITRYFRKNENVDDVFSMLVHMVRQIDKNIIRKQKRFIRREFKMLEKGDIHKFKRRNLWHHRFRKIRNALKGRTRLYIQTYRSLFLRLPIQEKTIVFESFLGKSYSDSPKYIYEYMMQNKMDYKYVWIVNEKKQIPGNAIQIKRFSLRYFYYMAISKYWVSNSRLPRTLHKREENIYLQTWHGTPLKMLVFDMKDIHSADPNYKRNFYRQSRRWDYLSSPNMYSTRIFRRAFKYEKEMLEFGYPRNDILYQKNNQEAITELKKTLNLPEDKKIILYAPTWRDDEFYERGKYKFTLQLKLDQLQKELGDEYIVLLRMHYFIASQLDISEYDGFAYDFSSYDDIAELYLMSDILITDYSSVFFDFANLKRPILFYTYDLEKYRDTLRGFYIDIEEDVPGPLLKTTEEVVDAVQNIKLIQDQFKDKYEHFYNTYCKWDDGNAARKTVETVFQNKSNGGHHD